MIPRDPRHSAPSDAARRVDVPGFRMTLGRHPPGSLLPRHSHDRPTICFVLRGGFTEYSRGEAADCPPATLKVMPAGEPHSNRFGSLETRGLRLDVDPRRFETLPEIAGALDRRSMETGGVAGHLARRLVAEIMRGDQAGEVAAEGIALELVAALSRSGLGRAGAGTPRWLSAAREMIQDGYQDRLTVAGLARAVGVHPSTLSRRYRQQYGVTVGETIRRLRVERAARELLETTDALSEIALRAGFYDQSHFTNLFRQALGVTPAVYRTRLG